MQNASERVGDHDRRAFATAHQLRLQDVAGVERDRECETETFDRALGDDRIGAVGEVGRIDTDDLHAEARVGAMPAVDGR